MNTIFRRNPDDPITEQDLRNLTETEWLVTNGLGGYASGTISGTLTRVFHGYLIAALPTPLGRTMMLNDIMEHIVLPDGSRVQLNGERTVNGEYSGGSKYLTSFRLDGGLPVWIYEIDNVTLEKRLVVPHRQNTVYLTYKIVYGTGSLKLELTPGLNMRQHEAPVSTPTTPYQLTVRENRYELTKATGDFPPLRLTWLGKNATFGISFRSISDVIYSIEQSRGYAYQGDLWSPGSFSAEISPSEEATLVASTESWEVMGALTPAQAWGRRA